MANQYDQYRHLTRRERFYWALTSPQPLFDKPPQQGDLCGIDGKLAGRLKNKRQIAELRMSHNAGENRTYLDKSIEGSDKEELKRFRKKQLSMQPGQHK